MNPQEKIFDIKSIRYGMLHIEPWSWSTQNLGSKNKAKARSRELGGAGNVIAARDAQHLGQLKLIFDTEKLRRRQLEEARLAAEKLAEEQKKEKANA